MPALPQLGLESSDLDQLSDADAVVLVTVHPRVDHASLAIKAQLFVDLRDATRELSGQQLIQL